MRFSRTELVIKKSKDQELRDKVKVKKKHKRIDSICEKAYNRSHGGVEKAESSQLIDGGNVQELRRSGRARKAPELLDSSPLQPKKRRKVDRSVVSSSGNVWQDDEVQLGKGDLGSKYFDGQNGGWESRLRSGDNNLIIYRRKKGETSLRGKIKLFEDLDGFNDEIETLPNDGKDGFGSIKSTVVNSKRLGRIKANDLASDNQDIDLGAGIEEDKNKSVDGVDEQMDDVDGLYMENNFDPVEEETAVQSKPHFEECQANDNVEMEDNTGIEKLVCNPVHDHRIETEVNCSADLAKDGHPDKLPVDDTCKRSAEKCRVADQKPRIKLGRRCGLCGGGVEGKPPKVLVLDGDSSGNEAYSGSSASEELNYDAFDGFGDDAGWLGRLLGPINDRFGIAGIWVHQQCAVWSPEVYFAGLGCLKNIRAALYRGRMLKCNRCRRPGATIGCRNDRCPKTYHLPCARAKGCVFDHRKFLIACADHRHLFQPHGLENTLRLKKLKSKKMRLDLRKISNVAYRQDIEAEEKWMEKFGEDEGFLKRESKRLHRDLGRIAPVYIGGGNSVSGTQFQGWESVAGLQGVIQCMKEVVILPLLYPEFFSNIGLTPPRGVLLHGYPGTGKTLVVRALVGACARGDKRIAYFARKGADCLGKYVGDAERQLRLLFQVAEKSQPSIIFFDEIDGLAPVRSKRQDQTHSSVVSTLLALMDGLKSRGSVIVIGATNRPDSVDPALRRPGRFDREIYFPLPSIKDREAILSLHTQKWPNPITGSLLKCVAKQTIGYAGADLQALCTQAAIIALRKSFPLQEVLSASETEVSRSKHPPIPPFLVEERDWLQALSCAPPPCSRREYGMAVNDVVASPLNTFLVPCFVQALTKLLVHLCLDERIWLPPALIKASALVKNVLVSASDRRRLQKDTWWSHIDDLIQDMNVTNEIEKDLLLANVLVGQTSLLPDITEEFNDETYSKKFSSNPQFIVARTGFLQNMSDTSCNKSGFQLLISGNSLSGQRHIASCLLHCFVGNVDVWKVDLASISHEGHGDMIHGLTRVLMRCASANLCMIYMPRIDLWAIETHKEDHHKSSSELQSPGGMSSNDFSENDGKHDPCPNAEQQVIESQNNLVKASYLWTCFIEQVESIRVNSSLIILATSELPFSHFPPRVREFFGSEIVNSSLSSALNHKVPRFCVHLDGKFDPDKVINTAAVVLTKDLAHQFIQAMQNSSHVYDNPLKENSIDKVNTGGTSTNNGISSPVCPINPVTVTNKIVKEKSTLELAISAVGYQILCYPHFAELCWVTSKLKMGPFANIKGPWKGWPFNSCIVRPISSLEKAISTSGYGNSKSKESSIVRGLAAVGLSAYRCEYKSLREICSEVRKVLESLVGRIDDKVKAGKNRNRFLWILSQAAYLDDMIMNWAHNLRSLEVDAPISDANKSDCPHSNNDKSEEDTNNKVDLVDLDIQEKKLQEDLMNVDTEGPANGEAICLDEHGGIEVAAKEPSPLEVLGDSLPVQNGSNEINIKGTTEEASGDDAYSIGNIGSTKLSNGFSDNPFDIHTVTENPPVNEGKIQQSPCTEVFDKPNNLSLTDDITMEINAKSASKSTCRTGDSSMCSYKCCAECISNLYDILQKMLNSEWECKRGGDSTIESIHDIVASLSVNLRLALGKVLQDGGLSGGKKEKYLGCRNSQEKGECENSEKRPIMECNCHTSVEDSASEEKNSKVASLGLESTTFIFKNGVLNYLETGIDVHYHCKFEKLCLASLTEWMAIYKEPHSFLKF